MNAAVDIRKMLPLARPSPSLPRLLLVSLALPVEASQFYSLGVWVVRNFSFIRHVLDTPYMLWDIVYVLLCKLKSRMIFQRLCCFMIFKCLGQWAMLYD